MEDFQAQTKILYTYMYEKFKSMEEKPYFRMGYLRLFFAGNS